MCGTVYTVVDTVNPSLLCIGCSPLVAASSRCLLQPKGRPTARTRSIRIRSTFSFPKHGFPRWHEHGRFDQRCKIIRQLCHPVNQLQCSLFKMLMTVSSGPYLHELQIPLGSLRLLECQ